MNYGRQIRYFFQLSNLLYFIAAFFLLNYLFGQTTRVNKAFLSDKEGLTVRAPEVNKDSNERQLNIAKEADTGPPIYILWSRWRRGSSFLGKLLAYAKSNTFYSYEPLHALGLTVFGRTASGSATRYALKLLLELMTCKYDLHKNLVKYFVETEFYFFHNPLTKRKCQPISSCNRTSILNQLCSHADLQVIKLLRLSLEFGKYFIEKNSRIKIIYLARDPRATFKSRSRLMWCLMTKDCHDPSFVCHILQNEIEFSLELRRKYPDRFFFLRYEDLALNPSPIFKALWTSLGQEFTPRIQRMIDKHTTVDLEKGTYGLKKNSKRKVFSWRSSMDYKSMTKVQENCKSPMTSLGYHLFVSEKEYNNQSISALTPNWMSPLMHYNEFVQTVAN